MSLNNRYKPEYKYFQKLRENIRDNKKILKFKKKKWAGLVKRLKLSKKYRFFNHDLYNISRKAKSFKNFYRSQLSTKQRLKLYYGKLTDTQLKLLARKATITSKKKSIQKKPSEILLFSLEARLETVLYRSYFVSSINSARQLIVYGNVFVNNKKVTNGNFLLKRGDLIHVSEKAHRKIKQNILKSKFWPLPPVNLEINYKTLNIYFTENIEFTQLSSSYSFWLNLKSVLFFYKN